MKRKARGGQRLLLLATLVLLGGCAAGPSRSALGSTAGSTEHPGSGGGFPEPAEDAFQEDLPREEQIREAARLSTQFDGTGPKAIRPCQGPEDTGRMARG